MASRRRRAGPGTKQITAPGACSCVTGPFGKITIDVPIADVSLDTGVAPISSRLYSVTASTMTLLAPPESVPPDAGGSFKAFSGPIGVVLFDLIDVVRAYDFVPGAGAGGGVCREADGTGDVPGNKGGSAHFHFHEDDCNLQPGSEDFSDSSSGTDFHSTQVTSMAYDTGTHTGWARDCWTAMQPFFERDAYVNDLGDEGEQRIRQAYGLNYERLFALKQKYDPTNFFRLNQNIQPSKTTWTAKSA
ncbi:MAG TPA: BBE domain-containing protein [Candidatus Dormibacteraeota bacterium]|nr:BBE domain-containing protein [Candidatus Dormibacteraeota bacterium]